MAWLDRLREAAYTSPSGTRIPFLYEDVSRNIEKKTTAFDFPDADGTYVQDLGHTGRRYPFRLIFAGADHDQEAQAFETALLERGIGKLEHPLYGTVDVVPFGRISQRDDLKTAANQSVFEVTFWETIDLIYPLAQVDPASAVIQAIRDFSEAAAAELNGKTQLEKATERATFKGQYQARLDQAYLSLNPVVSGDETVSRRFNTIYTSISTGIDTVTADAITLSNQTSAFIQTAGQAQVEIAARVEAFSGLIDSIIQANGSDEANTFYARDMFASGHVTGLITSALYTEFDIKSAAIEAAENILDKFQEVTDWRDDNFAALEIVDTGESYQALQEAVAVTAGFLISISFNLKQERLITLDRARTIIDLSAEIYGEVDEQLDFLISSNNLSGDEILELPEGREIVFYL